MVHGGGRGNEQALTAAKESGLRSPVRTSTFNFPHHRFRITANVVSLSDVYADDKLLNKPTEMRTVRTNMLSNPLQQLYVWHLEHRLRELGGRQEANPPEP